MMLFVKFKSGHALSIDCEEHDTVEALLREISAEKSYDDIDVSHKGNVLDRSRKLSDYEIYEGAVLHEV
uniref:Ubiquitin-like domain-containing protein n=1 Tax=Panagrolaimus sp. PS1159 TaxID=55785 RepID=A0AC35G7D3_9BILA